MEVSKLSLSDEVAQQRSQIGNMLVWMQEHPTQCRNTNIKNMCHAAKLSGVPGQELSLQSAMRRAVEKEFIFRHGTKLHSNFTINYAHEWIPAYVLESAPEEAKNARKKIKAELKENQYVDEVGCVTTRPKEPKVCKSKCCEKDEEYPELDEIIDKLKKVEVFSVPVEIKKENRGQNMNLSITLNLNLNS